MQLVIPKDGPRISHPRLRTHAMLTDLFQDDFPKIYTALVAHFPSKPWLRRVDSLRHQIKANPMSEEWLWVVNQVAYGLAEFEARGVQPVDPRAWDSVKHAMVFAGQVLEILKGETPDRGRKLIARIDGAIRNPDDMRGLLFELSLATALYSKGCSIEWMGEDQGKDFGTFDMLVDVPGIGLVEFECKSVSVDKGESIPHKVALDFINRLMPIVEAEFPFPPCHLFAVSILMDDAIPTDLAEQTSLADVVGQAIARADTALDGVCRLDMQCSGLDRFASELDEDSLYKLTNDLLGIQPAHQVIKTLLGGRYLAIRVWCVVPSTLEKRMKHTAKKAIRKQMSTTRPGCLAMCVERHTGEGLSAMADHQQNMLATVATSLLRNANHQHLAGVVFVSLPEMTRLTDTTVTGQSVVYAFDNQVGLYPNFGIQRLFTDK